MGKDKAVLESAPSRVPAALVAGGPRKDRHPHRTSHGGAKGTAEFRSSSDVALAVVADTIRAFVNFETPLGTADPATIRGTAQLRNTFHRRLAWLFAFSVVVPCVRIQTAALWRLSPLWREGSPEGPYRCKTLH